MYIICIIVIVFAVMNREECPLKDCQIVPRIFDYNGGELLIKEHAVKVTVPIGAIDKGCQVQIEAAASLFGPFIIPEGYHPISAYVWIGACYEFKKNLIVELEHDIVVSEEIMSELCILTACEKGIYGEKKKFIMHEDKCKYQYEIHKSTCKFFNHHFCSKCLALKDAKPVPPKRIRVYHYVPMDYRSKVEFITEVCFCYDLLLCKKVINCDLMSYSNTYKK